MDLKTLLSKSFQEQTCECGMKHSCPVEDVIIGEGAVEKAAALLSEHKNVLIVSDANTRPLAFDRLSKALSEKNISFGEVFFDTHDVLIPDEAAVKTIASAVSADTGAVIGIGSGVINDLCKYVSFLKNLPYMIIATAPSMDGYASVGAALIFAGMKVTKNARVAKWIVGDTAILKDAPMDMIRAGIGDILGKYSCLNDWRLANVILGEHFCDKVYTIVMDEVEKCKRNIEGCMKREGESIRALMESLVVVGIAMAFVGSSRPASGSEHHFSHFFEITGIVHNREYLPHGIDVAYSAILTAHLREMLAAAKPESFIHIENEDERMRETGRIYGPLSEEVLSLQKKVGFYDGNRVSVITEKWPEIKKILESAPTRREMTYLLAKAGYDVFEFTKFYGENVIRDAIVYAKDLKDRYTLLWLLYDVGLLELFARRIKLNVGWKGYSSDLLVAGHRGVRYTLPENTIPAYEKCLESGADMIEIDVRMTKDRELVIMHDAAVDRTTDGKGLICEMTLKEFKSLNCAAEYPSMGFVPAPTLEEFLIFAKENAPGLLIDFELKEYPTEGREAFAYECCDKALSMIDKYGFDNKCVINSFSGKLLEYIHRTYGGKYRLHGYYPFSYMGEMTMHPADILYCICMFNTGFREDGTKFEKNSHLCPKEAFDEMKFLGIIPWVGASVRGSDELRQSVSLGAELVTTDYPGDAMDMLKRMNYHK